jgi:hypothetical protein
MKRIAGLLILCASLTACAASETSPESVKEHIQASLDRTSAATIAEDIDAYMAEIPPDFSLKDESGETVTIDRQRSYVLRDWSVIDKTLSLSNVVESLIVDGDTATVITDQRWERVMQRPDKSGTDVILTTQRHKETWKRVRGRWYGYDIEELGGEIFINGKPYTPGE